MILTEEKTFIMPVTVVDAQDSSGLCKNDMMLEFTNLELLHAVLTCTMPAGGPAAPRNEKKEKIGKDKKSGNMISCRKWRWWKMLWRSREISW